MESENLELDPSFILRSSPWFLKLQKARSKAGNRAAGTGNFELDLKDELCMVLLQQKLPGTWSLLESDPAPAAGDRRWIIALSLHAEQ
ncbi:hypothetical protein UY3_10169 [Chelonia mydas]|uniref:Uncharacterized protein n=1 Tax=Chelonia mydas TaxID=8469 RepID=M7B6C2_CHEMY|nr:hypothetical protein UY3_10169 [Chelonia mydas]